MSCTRIAIIGFGEVGATFARAMKEHGADIAVYDALLDDSEKGKSVRARIENAGLRATSLEQAVRSAQYVLAMVTTMAARSAAAAAAQVLRPGQVYVDMNSTSPSAKQDIAAIIAPSGADFVEAAIIGAIGVSGARTEILTGGPRSPEVAQALTELGLRVSHYAEEIGKASMFKMLRSIFSKGMEALLLETMIAGQSAGIADDLWADMTRLFQQNGFEAVASNWMTTHAIAYERRFHEMEQVVETMEEIGVEPVMTRATEAFFRRSTSIELRREFPERPTSKDDVVRYLQKQLERSAKSH